MKSANDFRRILATPRPGQKREEFSRYHRRLLSLVVTLVALIQTCTKEEKWRRRRRIQKVSPLFSISFSCRAHSCCDFAGLGEYSSLLPTLVSTTHLLHLTTGHGKRRTKRRNLRTSTVIVRKNDSRMRTQTTTSRTSSYRTHFMLITKQWPKGKKTQCSLNYELFRLWIISSSF